MNRGWVGLQGEMHENECVWGAQMVRGWIDPENLGGVSGEGLLEDVR